jgi:hypothetical protein
MYSRREQYTVIQGPRDPRGRVSWGILAGRFFRGKERAAAVRKHQTEPDSQYQSPPRSISPAKPRSASAPWPR